MDSKDVAYLRAKIEAQAVYASGETLRAKEREDASLYQVLDMLQLKLASCLDTLDEIGSIIEGRKA